MSKKRRFAFIGMAVCLFAGVYSAGAASTMSEDDAKKLKDVFGNEVKGINAFGIFLNNFKIAAAMFIPAFGIIVGAFSAYSTGLVFKALTETTPQIAHLPPLLVLMTPFGIMEMISYGIAMSQSAILVNAVVRRKDLMPVLVPTLIQIGIVAALLLAGAFIEFYMIKALPPQVQITGKV